tara:strand:+ start:87 stop:626 length:540 start_codon:yes stop_codon:yes gene_type:complete
MKKQKYRYKASTDLNVGTMVQGMIGENKVANLFLENKYIVTRPDVDLGVDMVVSKPKKWGKRHIIKWLSIQVKYNTRIKHTQYGTALLVKVTPNNCDYIAIPVDKEVSNVYYHHNKVIFFPQPQELKGKEYKREFAFGDVKVAKQNGLAYKDCYGDSHITYRNQHKRRWAKDFYELPIK